MAKLNVTKEGRPNIYIPDKGSLKKFILARKLKKIHNFIPTGSMMLGADHDLEDVLKDIDRAIRVAIFTDPKANMGHSLALILPHDFREGEQLECFDIGAIKEEELEISKLNRVIDA